MTTPIWQFPFGKPSTSRPPTRPSASRASLFLMGVYPSALHVRWRLPDWLRQKLGSARTHVAALAVDVEPFVFWDGIGAESRVEMWRESVGWIQGEGPGGYGSAAAAINGTSGLAIRRAILGPLGISDEATWFTDAVPWFFIKDGTVERPQQADVIRMVYSPFALAMGLPTANLPARPSPEDLVALSIDTQRERLRNEILESEAPLVVTVGEEARRVMVGIADKIEGPPGQPMRTENHGLPGRIIVGSNTFTWYALVHPGNRSEKWKAALTEWGIHVAKGS